ncbi:ethanolamine ammonia-lyase subunit EutC [Acinetobacter populi]|uniref:Ethanolamine ammonia-lyase small subunit n=1 Tax=Acinetobacter populi TaxID=1582270 RepID=A0A1Z9Z3Y1_9GAMM|nr:ethanolamine ammonia-lyase subunit EutC [Acinetobacter populi]OUY09164.1 ethanolamine ammonia-lyase [Acinetobacter populi]
MKSHEHSPVHQDIWQKLKQYTDARIALGRAGCSVPTKPLLSFQYDHAQAKDAVLQTLAVEQLQQQLAHLNLDVFSVDSQATDKALYLKRPDFGRVLSEQSAEMLTKLGQDVSYDVAIVIGDGLSARAIEENAPKLVTELVNLFREKHWSVAPIVIATGSRVALGDQVAERLHAKMLVMLIGERPGLSSPDSLGIYYTWQAKTGCHDAMRNCISNVRPAGLPILVAAQRLLALMSQSLKLQFSGVHLKDQHEIAVVENTQTPPKLFLLKDDVVD